MSDIIYPSNIAPFIPSKDILAEVKVSEILPIVDPSGMVIGRSARNYCHSGVKVLHPVVHLHVFNRLGRLYLQKRAETKKLLPGCWDTAVGGHITYGESVIEALCRESSEEIGLVDFNPVFLKSYIWESDTERELVFVFAAIGDFHPVPNPDELADGRFWGVDEINSNMSTGLFTPNFEYEYPRIIRQLEALL